jgi:inner membrane protein
MNRELVYKLAAIGLLIVVLLAALARIGWLIKERQATRDAVVQEIARSSSFSQQLTGPIVVVPYRRTVTRLAMDEAGGKTSTVARTQDGNLYFLPERFALNGHLATELRARGIYQARLYRATNQISGQFVLPAQFGITDDVSSYQFGQPFVALGLSDIRGIGAGLNLKLNGQSLAFQPGSGAALLGPGVHALIPAMDGKLSAALSIELELKLQGTGDFHVTPVGRESTIDLVSDWPHPGFTGDYLPIERSIAAGGFKARWQTTFFATNLEEALRRCAAKDDCTEFNSRRLGVTFVDPVDQYLKSDRAIKYALLFIALTFAGFFLFEVLKQLAVHPVQYGLVGAALAVFYLLLLSLSEHIGFATAYLVSSAACVLLIAFYVSAVLASAARGMGFGAALGALYALLYTLLNAEDYALLMGSLLVFAILTTVMLLTRRVNWSSLTARKV